MSAFLTRFAPSPTGYLHLGHAAAAFRVWRAAEAAKTLPILRIEDIDTTRCKPEYTEAIYEDLTWLGFDWPHPTRVQSEHFSDYAAVVERLAARGLAYRCFKTRAELEVKPPSPMDAETEAAELEADKSYAWRLSLAAAKAELGEAWGRLSYQLEGRAGIDSIVADPARHGDIVIARKDSPSAYHLAATHDDALQGITHVIRGEDLIDAPHIQTLLQVLMGWPQPIYRHHGLIMGADSTRLSKRNGSIPLAELRRSGMTARDIWKRLGL